MCNGAGLKWRKFRCSVCVKNWRIFVFFCIDMVGFTELNNSFITLLIYVDLHSICEAAFRIHSWCYRRSVNVLNFRRERTVDAAKTFFWRNIKYQKITQVMVIFLSSPAVGTLFESLSLMLEHALIKLKFCCV